MKCILFFYESNTLNWCMFCIYVELISGNWGEKNSLHNNPLKRCFLRFNSSSPADTPRQSLVAHLSANGKWWDSWDVATNSWCQTWIKSQTGRRNNKQTNKKTNVRNVSRIKNKALLCGGELPCLVSHFVSVIETSAFRMPLVPNIIN